MKTVRLVTCNTVQDAYEVKNRLEREEIQCILTNENITNILPHFNYMLGSGIQILVDEKDLEKA
ncbi:MAG: hypothetical protein C0599_00570 [Salinivirgaceae bacterium]|nr:MAG: hypothetical protein C0599_00570 [Salinivirgaceae bacterium]